MTARLRLGVVIPTVGRAGVTRDTVARLSRQSRAPDALLVVAVGPDDVAGVAGPGVEIAFAERGLCKQRNHGVALVGGRCDLIVFFDDDFVPDDDYLRQIEAVFLRHPDVVGANGRIIADGVRGAGYDFAEAVALIEADRAAGVPAYALTPQTALYGCNMTFRASALEGIVFDDNLPLYGWQEDIDVSYQVGRRGRLVKCSAAAGVHMGAKAARSPGKRLGYSQIANPVYLLRKASMPRAMAWKLMTRNTAANLLRSLRPEPHVDRRGRLAGNLLAIGDLLRGRLDPRRILELN